MSTARFRLDIVDVEVDGDVNVDGDGDVTLDVCSLTQRASNRVGTSVDTARMLSFQRLDVYQRAVQFLSLVYDITGDLPRGNADRADQLTRSTESMLTKMG